MRSAHKISIKNPESTRPPESAWRRWEDNIKMDLKGIVCGGVNWFHLLHDLLNTIMILRVS